MMFSKADEYEKDQKKFPESLSENYAVLRDMDAGGFGQVKLGFRLKNLDPCAIKIADKTDSKVRKILENEEKLMRRLRDMNHKCLVKLYDAVHTDDKVFFCDGTV